MLGYRAYLLKLSKDGMLGKRVDSVHVDVLNKTVFEQVSNV